MIISLILRGATVAHLFAAGHHLVAVVRARSAADSPGRHALFVAINLAVALGFWRRPRYFLFAFGLLTVQQLASHGAEALAAWTTEQRVDVPSLLVLAWMPTALFLLWQDRRQASSRAARAA
jgi:hypothetical protein